MASSERKHRGDAKLKTLAPEMQRVIIDKALEMVMAVEELPNRESALEFISAGIIECYRERYANLNREQIMEAMPIIGVIQ
jgi:hypothetical protein